MHLRFEEREPRHVPPGVSEALGEAVRDRVAQRRAHGRHGRRSPAHRAGRGTPPRHNDVCTPAHDLLDHRRPAFRSALLPVDLDDDVLPLDVPEVGQGVAELRDAVDSRRAARHQERDARLAGHLRVSRPDTEADQRDDGEEDRPSSHSMISSARTSTDGAMVRPSTFAVLMLMTRSILVACSMGNSPGFAPLRILSTKVAARRQNSGKLTA
jgi:hypothetical protein